MCRPSFYLPKIKIEIFRHTFTLSKDYLGYENKAKICFNSLQLVKRLAQELLRVLYT